MLDRNVFLSALEVFEYLENDVLVLGSDLNVTVMWSTSYKILMLRAWDAFATFIVRYLH